TDPLADRVRALTDCPRVSGHDRRQLDHEMERQMNRIERYTLLTLAAYAKARPEFRARVLSHKKNRTIALGPNVTLIFEDELTIRYQVQEMLRVEKTFEE